MIKKVALCGATICETGNYGDRLLQGILEDKIIETIPDVNIYYIEKDHFFRSIIRAISKSDAFIYVPGGYLGYIEKGYSGSLKKSVQRIIYYYLPGLLYMVSNKPMALIGQGIGPYEYPVLRKMLSSICNYSKLTVVREQKSYDLLKKLGVKRRIEITADCAQVICNSYIYDTKDSINIRSKLEGKTIIYILYYGNNGGMNWKDKIYTSLESYINDNRFGFVIGGDSVRHIRRGLYNFSRRFPQDRTYIYDYKEPNQLLSILNIVDLILTPKLHTAITGCTLGKSVIDFSLQYDKTKLYFEKIGYPERVFDLSTVTTDEMTRAIDNYLNCKIILSGEIVRQAERNFELLENFLLEKY